MAGLIKVWPALRKMSIDARAAMRKERRDDLHSCQERIDELTARIETIEGARVVADQCLVFALGAFGIVRSELLRLTPGSPALAQAAALLSIAYPDPSKMPANIAQLLVPIAA